MEENKNIWNKTTMELTVKDQLLLATVTPIIMVGGMVAAGAVVGAVSSVKGKVQSKFANRKKLTVVEDK